LTSENDDPDDWALPFMQAMPSYAEISPGGTGIKVLARLKLAHLPAARRLLEIPERSRHGHAFSVNG
jgi:hypothetical protein